jgi:hypothetical protein
MNKTLISLLLLTSIIGTTTKVSAECIDCTVPNNIGVSDATRLNDTGLISIVGKYKLPTNTLNLSVRPSLSLTKTGLIGGGAALTLDTDVPVGTIYSGFGVSVDQLFPTSTTKTYGLIGVERKLDNQYSVFGDVRLPFASQDGVYKPSISVGIGYSF